MPHSCDAVESNLVGMNVAIWFLVIAVWCMLLTKLVGGFIRVWRGEDVRSVFAGYERVGMRGEGLMGDFGDPMHQ
jgi:hypothetical protein